MKNIFTLTENPGEEPAPRQVYGYRPYLLSVCAAWSSAMYGYDSAFIGGTLTLPSFMRDYGLLTASTKERANLSSNIVSTFQGGAFFGSALGFFLAERFGRKPIIILASCVFCIGAILQLFGHIGMLYAGRALTGLGVGASSMILPIYVAECSPAMIRGRLVGLFESMLQIALVFGFWVNYGVNKNIPGTDSRQWHIPVAIQFVPAGLSILSMPWMPESPRWLVSKNRSQKALVSLSWIRNLPEDHPYIRREIARIEGGVNHELEVVDPSSMRFSRVRELFSPGVRNRLFIGILLMVFQNLTGINAINYYSPTIFKAIGFTGTSVSLLATGVYGLVKMFTTLAFVLFFVDRFGRRKPLLIGAVGAGFAMFYLAIYIKVSNSLVKTPPKDAGANAAVAMIFIYAFFYGFSWNGIPWLFTAEVLPTRVRTLGMAIGTCLQWLSQFIVVYSLPHMITSIGYGTFLFFGSCTVCAFIFAYFFVPETGGVMIEDMVYIFGPDVSVFAKAARRNYESNVKDRPAFAVDDEKASVVERIEEA